MKLSPYNILESLFKLELAFIKKVTKPQYKKLLSLFLSFLILVVSIRYILIRPKQIIASDVFIKFDEGYGTSNAVNDSNGAVSAGSITGAIWKTEDLCFDGKCLYFDGDQDYVVFADDDDLDFAGSDSFTITGWFRHAPITSGTHIILAKYETTGADGGYKVYMESDGDITCGIDNNNSGFPSDSVTSTAATYDDNKWHHFACVKNGSTSLSLYLDGQLIGTDSSITSSSLANNDSLYIGIDGDGSSNDFRGFIDEVKIYRSAKTASEINSNYIKGAPLGGASASFGSANQSALSQGLVGYWKMDQSSGNASDYSGNGLTLTNNGTVTYVSGRFGKGSEHVPDSTQYFSTTTTINDVKSVSFWVNPDSTTNYYISLTTGAYIISSSGTLSATGFTNPVIYVNGNVSSTISADVWQLVTITTDTAINADTFYIGRQGSNYFDGTIDEVRLYNRALSPAEVQSLYNWGPGPIAYYAFEEGQGLTAYDSSGNQNQSGTIGINARWVNGKIGKALEFPGEYSENRVWIPMYMNPRLDNDQATVSLWVKYNKNLGNGGKRILVLIGAWSSHIYWEMGPKIVEMADVNDNKIYLTYTDDLHGAWHHLTAVRNGTVASIYIDGVLKNTVTNASIGNWDVYYGSISVNEYHRFAGIIDEVKFYNYARTPAQIIEDMNAGHPAPGSPVGSAIARWDFDEGYGNTAHNQQENLNHLTIYNPGTSPWCNNAKTGKGLCFATQGYASAGDVSFTDGISQMTISFWLKTSAQQAGYALISKSNFSNQNQFALTIDTPVNDDLRFYVANSTSDTSNYYTTTNLNLTTASPWTHIAVVYNGQASADSRVKIFKNGNLVAGSVTGTIPTSLTSGTTSNLKIGASDDINHPGASVLYDEIQIFISALTDDQVKQLYNQSAATVMGALSTDSSGNASWSDERSFCPPGDPSATCAPVAWWKLDENSGAYAYDTTTNDNDGIIVGSPQWVSGKVGSALNLDTSSKRIEIADNNTLDMSNTMTIELWARRDSSRLNAWNTIIDKGSEAWEYWLGFDNDNYFCFMYNPGDYSDGDRVYVRSYGRAITDTDWHHYAATYSNIDQQVVLYIDGVKIYTTSTTATIYSGSGNVTIGQSFDRVGSNNFTGLLDDIKIYNYARTPAQIAWDYNRGAPVVYWQFDECTGNTVYDASFKANRSVTGLNATLYPQSSGNTATGACNSGNSTDMWYNGALGKYNSSLDFDGIDDYAVSGNTAIVAGNTRTYTNASWGGWFKPASIPTTKTLIMKGNNSSDNEFRLTTNASGYPSCEIYSGGWQTAASASTALATNTWTHLICVYNGSTLKLYVNGVEKASQSISSNITSSSSTPLSVGRNPGGTGYFDGLIDEVKIWNYPLTTQQIKLDISQGAVSFKN